MRLATREGFICCCAAVGRNTFCWYEPVHDAQRGFLFFLRTHFTPFCKINKCFLWYRCSLAAFILKGSSCWFAERFCSHLWLVLRAGGPRGQWRRGCALPTDPSEAALGLSVRLSVPLAGRRWHLCHTGATCPELELGLCFRGYLGSVAQICLCHGHVCTELV